MKKRFLAITTILIIAMVVELNTTNTNISIYLLSVYIGTYLVLNYKKFEIYEYFNK